MKWKFEIKNHGFGFPNIDIAGNSVRYQRGYKKAVDLLYQQIAAENNEELVYPYFFNSRHYLELKLKDILEFIYKHEGKEKELNEKPNHDLRELWVKIKSKILEYDKDFYNHQEIKDLEKFLIKWDEIDRKSDGFRYPKRKTGEDSFPLFATVDVVEYHKLFCGAMDLLTGIDYQLDMMFSYIREMETEALKEMDRYD